jgi:hypothetical protein
MNMITKYALAVVQPLLVTSLLTMLLMSNASAAPYRFENAGHPVNSTVEIQLVDEANGRPVKNAELYVVHEAYRLYESYPPIWETQTSLRPDGEGAFLANADRSDTLDLAARVPSDDQPIRGTVHVD